uniref:Uncharacterized protein n=1 Tax=Stegastes partitus TaxID=144197 RepID=A0A3B4ZJN3_9TELE
MAPAVPLLAVRGSAGTSLLRGPPQCEQHSHRTHTFCRCVTFSKDGTLLAWKTLPTTGEDDPVLDSLKDRFRFLITCRLSFRLDCFFCFGPTQ